MAYTFKLKDGSVATVCKGARNKTKSKEAKAKRLALTQKGKTNVGNPNEKGKSGVKQGAFDPKSKSHKKAMRKQARHSK